MTIKYTTTEHEFDAQETECGNYYYDALYTVDWVLEDHGIGEYEFWGSPGVDTQMAWSPSDITINEFTVYGKWPNDDVPLTRLKNEEVYIENPWVEDIEGWCWHHAERLDGPE